MRDPVKIYFGLVEIHKPKTRYFNATSLSTYDLSTVNITLPHIFIQSTLIDLI